MMAAIALALAAVMAAAAYYGAQTGRGWFVAFGAMLLLIADAVVCAVAGLRS